MPEFIGHYTVKKEIRIWEDSIEEAVKAARDMMWAIDGDKTQLLGVTSPGVETSLLVDKFDYKDPSR